MKKIIPQVLALVAAFFALWFVLSRVDWMSRFKLENTGDKLEQKLGEISWDLIQSLDKEITDDSIMSPIDSLLIRICQSNGIDREKVKLRILEKAEVNAFALPDNYLVLFTGLISACEKPEELAGVMAHELAHMEKAHIMQKLVKETGLSVLISLTSGGGNPEVLRQLIKTLTSSAYDRSLESEADLTGVDYLAEADIDPSPFADFLYRMSIQEKDLPEEVFWVTSHPGSEERAKDIVAHILEKKINPTPVMDSVQWHALRTSCGLEQ